MAVHPMRKAGTALELAGADVLSAGGALKALCPVFDGGRALASDPIMNSYAESARDDLNCALEALDEAQGRKTRHQPTLDAAWTLINALGGTFDRNDPEACGFDRAIQAALAAIEGMSDEKRTASVASINDAPASFQKAGDVGAAVVGRLVPRHVPVKSAGAMGTTTPGSGAA